MGKVFSKAYFSGLREYADRVFHDRVHVQRNCLIQIYATSIDYDPKTQTTRRFFAIVQNQLHWAIPGETAAEVIYHRADSEKEHMGLQTWKDSPNGKIQRLDVVAAKNYLTEEKLSAMARIVNAYLDLAELRALFQQK